MSFSDIIDSPLEASGIAYFNDNSASTKMARNDALAISAIASQWVVPEYPNVPKPVQTSQTVGQKTRKTAPQSRMMVAAHEMLQSTNRRKCTLGACLGDPDLQLLQMIRIELTS